MRRIICLAFVCCLLFGAAACGKQASDPPEKITLFPPHTASTAAESTVSSGRDSASLVNKTYGTAARDDAAGVVTDYSKTFRTDDSYALESVALQKARQMFAGTISMPETLKLTDVKVIECADDGECVYYRFYLQARYRVETGEEIRRKDFLIVGVRKSDQSAFDASDALRGIMIRYSIYKDTVSDSLASTTDPQDAAVQIALRQLKDPDTGRVVQAVFRDDLSDLSFLPVYDVVCVGRNDYDMEIPCCCTVYLQQINGGFRQITVDRFAALSSEETVSSGE